MIRTLRHATGLAVAIHVIVFLAAVPRAMAQPYWTSAGMPHAAPAGITYVHYDEPTHALYMGGYFDVDPDEPLAQKAVLRYANGQWDTLWVNCSANSVVVFHDTLFVAGSCSPATANVKYWDNGTWLQYGIFNDSYATRLRVIDDTLYCVGGFTTVDGQPCSGLARLVGGQWQPLPLLPEDWSIVWDIIEFEGELLVCGNGQFRIARLVNGEWLTLGTGVVGGQSILRVMQEYQGDLYIAGNIYMGEGNPGRDIMRWHNGTWEGLSEPGLQLDLGVNGGTSTVFDLNVHDSLLFVGGGFRYAGGVEAKGLATWNGEQWCGVPGNLTDEWPEHWGCLGMAFYEDTLVVGCGLMADDDTVGYAAKYIGETYLGPCSTVGVNDAEQPAAAAPQCWYGQGFLHLPAARYGGQPLYITDVAGRLVYTGLLWPGQNRVLLPDLNSGMYLVQAPGLLRSKFWKP